MTMSTVKPKRTGKLEDSYKPEEEVSTVLDPKAVDDNLLDRLPTPTGYRLLVLPYAGPKKQRAVLFYLTQHKRPYK